MGTDCEQCDASHDPSSIGADNNRSIKLVVHINLNRAASRPTATENNVAKLIIINGIKIDRNHRRKSGLCGCWCLNNFRWLIWLQHGDKRCAALPRLHIYGHCVR